MPSSAQSSGVSLAIGVQGIEEGGSGESAILQCGQVEESVGFVAVQESVHIDEVAGPRRLSAVRAMRSCRGSSGMRSGGGPGCVDQWSPGCAYPRW